MIKNTRLGINKERRTVNKPSEKFKKIYVDDWNPEDDTSKDINPLYQNKYQGKILFGKGMLAGIDEEEQKVDINKKKHNDTDGREVAISWQDKPASEMTTRDWMILREDNNIIVQGKRVPYPFIRWKELNVDKKILEAISEIGYEKPSPIQMQAIPIVLDKRDLVGIAPTGMGKSWAFLIPMIQFFLNLPKITGESIADGPYGLVLAPTRELSIQIEAELNRLSQFTHLRTAWLIGGRSANEQSSKISRGWEVIIGTPGRILDCLNKRLLVLNQCFYLILDEADKMIEMDLVEDVTKILSFIEEHALETILSHLDPETKSEFVNKLHIFRK